jgi:hypothetical protein
VTAHCFFLRKYKIMLCHGYLIADCLCCCAEGVLEGLLEQYVAELRGTCTSSPLQAQQCGSISSDEGHTCGVCLDAAPTAMMTPCEHTMCGECS